GYHVIIEGTKPESMASKAKRFHDSRVEVYSSGRYMTVTGQHIDGYPVAIEQRQAQLESACKTLFRDQVPAATPVKPAPVDDLDDHTTLNRMFSHCKGSQALFNGQQSNDASGDDLALCNHLAFMTGSDPTRMDRLFRQSGLMRDKWDKRHRSDGATYGQMTIEQAIKGTKNAYTGQKADNVTNPKAEAQAAMQAAEQGEQDASTLPPFPDDLMGLPYGLGEIQLYVYNRMKYPDAAAAGFTALAIATTFAQKHVTVNSYEGLGLNEQYLVLAPTGFGKEDMRKAVSRLKNEIGDQFSGENTSTLQYAAPASAQGLHQALEEDHCQMFLADEFAEWLRQSSFDGIKQAAVGYLMQIYSSALGTVDPGRAVTKKYTPVEKPRLSILATSTAEAMLGAMTSEQADSGAYNRWLILPMENKRIHKRYEGLVYDPPANVMDCLIWIDELGDSGATAEVRFSREGKELFKEIDSTTAEPIRFKDGRLGGRLSEQAIKMAALIALSDKRTTIDASDLQTAYNIRLGLYHRTAAMVADSGAISGMHVTGQAFEQIKGVLHKKATFYRGEFKTRSRKFKELSERDKDSVVQSLISNGLITPITNSKFTSNLYQGED
ncbi:hypothetical protein HLB35_16305, partial [Halomonas sp. TBZ9]